METIETLGKLLIDRLTFFIQIIIIQHYLHTGIKVKRASNLTDFQLG